MVELQEIRLFLSILVVATLVLVIDVMIMPILSNLCHLASATVVLAYVDTFSNIISIEQARQVAPWIEPGE